jgi:tape measure domain-containing protein
MTLGLTVPIAAAGAAALQSFGDFERLQNALVAITGDASIAAEQFERLKVIAEAPGLALPQVVKASASLQAVGLSALEAEETIKQYGNAVARSGGGAAEFDGAVLALTQIASKGKISAEELNQLGERIFEIRPALQAAFGTSNSEELQKLGISAQDFIARTTAELGKLERVQGGLSNSFENFRDSVQGSLATLGKAISDSIDFPAILNGISDAIKSVTNAFNDLSPEQKRFAVVFAGLTALVGPAVFAYGKLTQAYGLLRVEYYRIITAALAKVKAELLAKGATEAAEKATITSTLAIRASLAAIAPYLLAIGALVAVAYGLSKAMDKAGESINVVTELNQQASESVATEKAQTQALIGVINDQTKSINDKKGALAELKKINPEYFGDLDIERDGIKKINDQYTDYIANITKAAKAKIGGEKLEQLLKDEITSLNQINEIEKKITDQTLKLGKARQNTSALGASTGSMGSYSAVLAIEQQITNLKNQKQALQDSQNQIKNNIKETENFIIANTNFNKTIDDGGGGGGGISDNLKKQLQEISNELAEVDKLFKAGLITGSEASEEKLKLLEDRLKLLVINGFNPTSQAVLSTKNEIKNLQNELGQQFATVDIFDNLSKQFTNLDNQLKVGTITSFQATSEKVQLLTAEMQRLKDEGVSPASEEFQRLTKIYDNLANAGNTIDISINTLIDNFKSAGLALNSIEKTALDELSSKISEVQNKSSKGLIGSTDASIEKVDAINNALKTLTEQNLGESNLAKELQNQLVNLNPFIEQVGFLKSEMQRLKDEGISPTSEEFQKLNKSYIELGEEQDNYVKNIAALITGVKDLSDPFNEIQTDTLTELSKQITIIQDKTKAGLLSDTDADVERINAIKSALNTLIEQGLGGTDAAAKLQEQLKGAESSVKTTYTNIFDFLGNKIASLPGIAEKLGENVQTLGPKIGKAFEGAVAAVQQVFSTFGAFFDMQEAKIDQFEEKEKERIANSIMGEEAKEAALANLNEKVLKKRKALARKQAALDKASALFSATIAGANAVLQALAVPLIGPVLAKITAGLVAAQLAFIAATPLPSLAIGTDLVKSDGLAMLHKGEAVVPADVAKGGFNGSGGMAQVSGRIQGTDIILVSDYAMNFKNRIR